MMYNVHSVIDLSYFRLSLYPCFSGSKSSGIPFGKVRGVISTKSEHIQFW